jgi:WXG100 family type VII secretion target
MPKDLNVDPIDLRLSVDHVNMHAAELAAVHAASDADIEAAHTGWVGSSAAALHARFAEWQEATTTMTADLAAHGAAITSAADGYDAGDTTGAKALDQQF